MSLDFFSSILTYEHSLWHFKKTFMIPNHTIADFFIAFTNFPLIVLLYLSRYPHRSRFLKQFAYISFWIFTWTLIEYIFLLTKMITFHNGWHIGFSFLLWCIMFIALRLHHTRPLWAWLICLGYSVFVISYFKIPINNLN
ncbi:CBO0543 family protein [Ammoniphilus sp. 3BR4]|uniref:CBO0543 family protein n=1 Tax=Ammoniphilus sp. 3BR4 TaxID=3158265 RepID=UPI0034667F77